MASPMIPEDAHISAMSPLSLSWDAASIRRAKTKHPRKSFCSQGLAWQQVSQQGSWAAIRSVVDQSKDRKKRKQDPNRIVEIHALAGAIGEQLSLCWASEQDAQRIEQSKKMKEEHKILILRAVSEGSAHFLLGAAHSLGNLALRVALLDSVAQAYLRKEWPKADFSPGSVDRRAWVTLSVAADVLDKASSKASNPYLSRCVGSHPPAPIGRSISRSSRTVEEWTITDFGLSR